MAKFRVFIKDMAALEVMADSWEVIEDEGLVVFYTEPGMVSNSRSRSIKTALAVKLSEFQAVEQL